MLVEVSIKEFSGTGSLQLIWQYMGSELRLTAKTAGGEIATPDASLAKDESAKCIRAGEICQFAVRDGAAYLMCGDAELTAEFESEEFRILAVVPNQPPAGSSSCQLSLVAENCRLEIGSIRIARDVYYRTGDDVLGRRHYSVLSNDDSDGPLRDAYFMLGDNVAASKDSRFIGPIPAKDLIGVARWRYWPRARWHELD